MQAKQIAKMMADAKNNLDAGQKFLAENAKKPGVKTTASGLQYQVDHRRQGRRSRRPTDVVRVHYKGTLLDGKTFDSSYDRGEPATFPLDQVVPGWQEGIALMPVGSKYKFWIPANWATATRARRAARSARTPRWCSKSNCSTSSSRDAK